MKASAFFSDEDRKALHEAVHAAEKVTSGEIRLYIEDECVDDVMDRAAHIFASLEMHKTKQRNGVLIYLAFTKHKFAIIGDAGIHAIVGQDFWNSVKEVMRQHFTDGRITQGLIEGITGAGEVLKTHFPYQGGDRNELPDDIIIR